MADILVSPFAIKRKGDVRATIVDMCSHVVRRNQWLRKRASAQVFFVTPDKLVTGTLRGSELASWGPQLEDFPRGHTLEGLAFFSHTTCDHVDETGVLHRTETGYALWIRMGASEEMLFWGDTGDVAFRPRQEFNLDLSFLQSHIDRLRS